MKLCFVGDISLHNLNSDNIIIEEKIIDIFNSSDLVVGNLENPITNSNNKQELLPIHLKASGNAIKFLNHFNVLNLANNHIFDYGLQGYKDTIFFLNKHNIKHFGAGLNCDEARDALKIKVSEQQKVALISGTRWNNASGNNYGTAGFKGHSKTIKKLKEKKYFIVYYPHWGYEYITIPPPDVRRHAKKMIDFGVDLIIGTHPHVLQGFEKYNGKYLFYSLGNFIFNSSIIKKMAPEYIIRDCQTSAILFLNIENRSVYDFEIHPIKFIDEKVELLDGYSKENLISYVYVNSKIFKEKYSVYRKKYYTQVSDIVKQNLKVRNVFQNFDKQNLFNKIALFKNVSSQDILNRIMNLILHK